MPCVIWRLVTKIRHLSYLIFCHQFKQFLKLSLKLVNFRTITAASLIFFFNDKICFLSFDLNFAVH